MITIERPDDAWALGAAGHGAVMGDQNHGQAAAPRLIV
jgi:hypothetical protein